MCCHSVVIVLAAECIRRLEEITGQNIPFYKVDLLHTDALREVFRKVPISCIVFKCIFIMCSSVCQTLILC